jgi:hypothetical protein
MSARRRALLVSSLAFAACSHRTPGPPADPAAAVARAIPVAPVAEVSIVRHETERRVDVLFDSQPFTSYQWPDVIKKPVLFPIRTDRGGVITRGWPLEPRPGEATDHRHHVGLWLNYGNVNGVDFWGHSTPDPKKGTIFHRGITATSGGHGRGQLGVTCEWVMPDGNVVLHEETRFVFSGGAGRRVIDRSSALTAVNGPVRFEDNKEGTFGLRVGSELEHPSDKNPKGTGHYHSSEGFEGEAVWGTRGRWNMLTAQLEGAPVTVVIFDHPHNPGFPTYWHARPWGLFAANPLGQKALSGGKETLDFALAKGADARFAYRVLILTRQATPEEIEAEYKVFLSDVP